MKKVAIITITNGTNYGNRLQNFALAKVVEKLGFEVETLRNDSLSIVSMIIDETIPRLTKPFKHSIRKRRSTAFKDFNSRYVKFSRYRIFSIGNLRQVNKKYDFFIIGSDQVWNPHSRYNKAAMLGNGLSSGKIISYAASFGVSSIPTKLRAFYSKYLMNIQSISVRETNGVKIIKEVANKSALQVLDPTLLIDTADYVQISQRPKNMNGDERYILTYFLGGRSDETKHGVYRLAKSKGLSVINLCDTSEGFSFTFGPSEFIYLFSKAELILTDSFHACVFAMIFSKPFVVYSRIAGNKKNMNSRIDTLLGDFNQLSRLNMPLNHKDLLRCDYSDYNQILHGKRNKSLAFLKRSLHVKDDLDI